MTKQHWVILGTLGLAGGAFVLWQYMRYRQGALSGVPANPMAGLFGQPEQQYPVSMQKDPRVDHANQPWYGGSTAFQGAQQSYGVSSAQDTAAYLAAGASVVHSLSDIWGELDVGSWFGGEDTYSLAEWDAGDTVGSYEDAGVDEGYTYGEGDQIGIA